MYVQVFDLENTFYRWTDHSHNDTGGLRIVFQPTTSGRTTAGKFIGGSRTLDWSEDCMQFVSSTSLCLIMYAYKRSMGGVAKVS